MKDQNTVLLELTPDELYLIERTFDGAYSAAGAMILKAQEVFICMKGDEETKKRFADMILRLYESEKAHRRIAEKCEALRKAQ